MVAGLATAADPAPSVLAGQGPVPAAATIERFDGLGIDLIPGTGLLPATVPGAVGAWLTLLRDHGTMHLRDVLDYALGYAANGHPLAPGVVGTIGVIADLFRAQWPSSAAQWLPDGRGLRRLASRLRADRQPALARPDGPQARCVGSARRRSGVRRATPRCACRNT